MSAAGAKPENIKVTIVGGGNAAHALAALLPHKGFPTSMYCPYQDEAAQIQLGLDQQGFILAHFASHNDPSGEVRGCPVSVSKSPADVIPEADVIIMPLPSFTYAPILESIKEHLRAGQKIGITPGQGGFDWIAREILGEELMSKITIFAIMPMPFNCRIKDFGKIVEVQELKRRYRIGCSPVSELEEVLAISNAMFGTSEPCGNFLTCTLYPINAVIHPARLWTLLREWTSTGSPLAHNPLFYEDLDAEGAKVMDKVNLELIEVAEKLSASGIKVEVPHIFDFLAKFVYEDPSDKLQDFFTGNAAYKGFRCPLKELEDAGGWVPDFENRYFTEDIPMGLCVYKGVADLVDAVTPTMDEIITWAQEHMKKKYIVEGHLVGADVGETTAPQRFGIKTLEELRNLYSP